MGGRREGERRGEVEERGRERERREGEGREEKRKKRGGKGRVGGMKWNTERECCAVWVYSMDVFPPGAPPGRNICRQETLGYSSGHGRDGCEVL